MLANNFENGNKNPWGKKWVVNRCSKLNSNRDINFLRWLITDELWRLSVSQKFMYDSSVIDHFLKFITGKILGFEKWFTTHFLPHGHRKNISAFLLNWGYPFCIIGEMQNNSEVPFKKIGKRRISRIIDQVPLT